MGYLIGVSFPGLQQVAAALDDVAAACTGAGAAMAGHALTAPTPAAVRLGDELLDAAHAAATRAASHVSALAQSVTSGSGRYAGNEQTTAADLAAGRLR